MHDTPTLPEDPAALRALLLEALGEVDALSSRCDSVTAERDALAAQNERLQHLLLKLQRLQFGRKSERLPEDQLQFAFEEIEATLAGERGRGGEAVAARRARQPRQRRRAGRGRLPAHLPRDRAGAGARGDRLPLLPGRRWSRSAATRRSGST